MKAGDRYVMPCGTQIELMRFSESIQCWKHWAEPVKWNAKAKREGRRARVFCASMGDWLDLDAPLDQFVLLLDLIHCTPELDWLLLSKRIGNWRKRLEAVYALRCVTEDDSARFKWLQAWIGGTPPANVWLGATVVNQDEADRDVPKLLDTPARVRFLSIEPMLGPVDVRRWLYECCGNLQRGNDHGVLGQEPDHCCGKPEPRDALHWIIAGGESGHGARPAHPDWFRSLRDQCAAAGVAFHFKQWGEWAPEISAFPVRESHRWPIEPNEPAGGVWSYRIGKKAAGRLLDGVEHKGFPL